MKSKTETLKTLYEYDKSFFTYDTLEKEMWNDLISKAKNEFKVQFDTENNYSVRSQRLISIPVNSIEYKFKCELFQAGGDWQVPIYYFRCQLIKGFLNNISPYSNSHFIFIPGKEKGNFHLLKGTNDFWVAPDNNDYKENIDPKPDERKCWENLHEYLRELVNSQTEKLKREEESKNPENKSSSEELNINT